MACEEVATTDFFSAQQVNCSLLCKLRDSATWFNAVHCDCLSVLHWTRQGCASPTSLFKQNVAAVFVVALTYVQRISNGLASILGLPLFLNCCRADRVIDSFWQVNLKRRMNWHVLLVRYTLYCGVAPQVSNPPPFPSSLLFCLWSFPIYFLPLCTLRHPIFHLGIRVMLLPLPFFLFF